MGDNFTNNLYEIQSVQAITPHNILLFKKFIKSRHCFMTILYCHCNIVTDNFLKRHAPWFPFYSVLQIHALLRYGNIHWICHKEAIDIFLKFILSICSFLHASGQKRQKKIKNDQEVVSYEDQFDLHMCTSFVSIRKIQRILLYRVQKRSAVYNFLLNKLPPIIERDFKNEASQPTRKIMRFFKKKRIKHKYCANDRCKYWNQKIAKNEEMFICSGCHLIYFCSKKCQKICWTQRHRHVCH